MNSWWLIEAEPCKLDEAMVEQMLTFARRLAERLITRWNTRWISPLSQADCEDILSEVSVAVLRFKQPEDCPDWRPLLTGFVKQVAWRTYCRWQKQRRYELSLDEVADLLYEEVTSPIDEQSELVQQVAQCLCTMPRHHALALLLPMESDLRETLLEQGGRLLRETLNWEALPLSEDTELLSDAQIAQLLHLTPRAVIRARQHAREKIRAKLCYNTQVVDPNA
ncbi:MAG: hypothetical protein SNJ72_04625 [Fimbriimonadales bacterium]